ncbi:phospholipid-transporting ATPase ABCA3-like [Amblyomma americanum]
MVTWIFPKGMMAVLVGFLLWRIVPTNVTRVASKEGASLAGYFLIGKWEKLLVGVFPPYALFSVLRIIAISRDYEKAGGWSVVTKRALGRDTVTILEIWAVMLLTDIVKAFAAWYFSKVLPWSTGNPQNPSFFLTPSYWKPIGGKTQDANPDSADPARFEELPADTPTVIVAKNLTKVYGHKTALDGLNLKIYQSRITVLLGHNGAGKSTLMNILTGMQAPTSGVARVCGYNVTTHRNEVRQLVSFCQQTDVFFDNMTVIENLLYFGSLKGVPMNKLRQSIASTLEVVDLQDKAYAMPNELSGGMKRRLSIAITIVSQPQVLILDEPTAGMDPETRRHVWDTLQVVAKERTLLLSSHDMNEADAIGDQVVVMASGKTICSGSTAFLKKACGVGYKLILEKVPKAFNLQKVFGVVEKVVPTATVEDEKKGEVTIALKTLDHSGFPVMFETLEGASQKLGIGSIGVSVSSMKDVYLKINLDWAPEGKAQEVPVDEKDIDAVIAPINKQRTAARVFIALFIKRLIHLVRSRGILLGCVVLPLGLLALMSWQLPMPSLASQQESFLSDMKTIPVSLAVHCPGSVVVIGESPATRVSEKVRVLVESEGSSVQRATDVRKELNAIASEDLPHYMSTYAMALEFRKDTVTLMPNPTSPVSLPILLNLFITSRLLEQTRQPLARITATIAYIQSEYVPAAFTIFLYRLWVWFHWASLSAFSYSLGFAAYAAFPVAERLGGAREVQLMTGMWGAEFVFAHFVFDMLHHAAFAGAWSLIQFAFSSYSIAAAAFGVCRWVTIYGCEDIWWMEAFGGQRLVEVLGKV